MCVYLKSDKFVILYGFNAEMDGKKVLLNFRMLEDCCKKM